jgi:hypothetical protein
MIYDRVREGQQRRQTATVRGGGGMRNPWFAFVEPPLVDVLRILCIGIEYKKSDLCLL